MPQITIFILFLMSSVSWAENYNIKERPDIKPFIQRAISETKYSQQELIDMFQNVTKNDKIISKIKKPYEDLNWSKYKKIFLKPKMISSGSQFKKQYISALDNQSKLTGIPANVIVAIIGIETFFGQCKFDYNALEALSTLSFDYPKRAKFFSSELIALLKLSRSMNIHPSEFKSSYAGAIGIPQFMPSSYLDYAKGSKTAQADLINSYEDSISSIGNYLIKKGKWENGGILTTYVPRKKVDLVNNNDEFFLKFSTETEKAKFSKLASSPAIGVWCADKRDCWILHNNFFSILSYNKSPKYAMAVIALSNHIV